jgi:hypothetical protein
MSNPWQPTKTALRTTDLGALEEFCEVAAVREEGAESELVSLQDELLRLMEEYRQVSGAVKARHDLEKYGEFISKAELEYKVKLLRRLQEHLLHIVTSKPHLVSSLASDSRVNCIVVETDKQPHFLHFLQLACQDTSFWSLLSAGVHEQTLESVQRSLEDLLRGTERCQEAAELYWSLQREVKLVKW